jgi:hypothetical protein
MGRILNPRNGAGLLASPILGVGQESALPRLSRPSCPAARGPRQSGVQCAAVHHGSSAPPRPRSTTAPATRAAPPLHAAATERDRDAVPTPLKQPAASRLPCPPPRPPRARRARAATAAAARRRPRWAAWTPPPRCARAWPSTTGRRWPAAATCARARAARPGRRRPRWPRCWPACQRRSAPSERRAYGEGGGAGGRAAAPRGAPSGAAAPSRGGAAAGGPAAPWPPTPPPPPPPPPPPRRYYGCGSPFPPGLEGKRVLDLVSAGRAGWRVWGRSLCPERAAQQGKGPAPPLAP